MNFSGNYNDNLDGDFLACKPGHIAVGVEFVCTFGLQFVGWAHLGIGLWLLYLVYTHRCHRKQLAKLARQRRSTFYASNARNPPRRDDDRDSSISYMERILLTMVAIALGFAVVCVVNGFGTMYSTTHIRGQIGDIAATITYPVWWYLSLLQYRGAKYFKSSVPQPQGSIHHNKQLANRFHFPPSPSTIIDIMQSWLAPVIAITAWGLLRASIITRNWYMISMLGLVGLCGLRSFMSILFLRLATLRRVASMINAKTGTHDEKVRRRGFLMNKMVSLVVDSTTVFCMSVALPTSFILAGSTFNSRQFAIHGASLGSINLTGLVLTCCHLHSKFKTLRRKSGTSKKKKKKRTPWTVRGATNSRAQSSVAPSKGKSLSDGSSVVQNSDV